MLSRAIEATKSDVFFKDSHKRPTNLLSKKLANLTTQNGFVKSISDAAKLREVKTVSMCV